MRALTPTQTENLTVQQLAERWHVQPITLRRWRRAGELPAVKIGPRRVIFRLADVLKVEAAKLTR